MPRLTLTKSEDGGFAGIADLYLGDNIYARLDYKRRTLGESIQGMLSIALSEGQVPDRGDSKLLTGVDFRTSTPSAIETDDVVQAFIKQKMGVDMEILEAVEPYLYVVGGGNQKEAK